MKLQKKEKVVLAIIICFFILLIVIALIIRFNYDDDKIELPYNTSNAKTLENEILQYYEVTKEKSDKIDSKQSVFNDIHITLITSNIKSEIGDYYIPTFKAYYYDEKTDKKLTRKEVATLFNYTEDNIYDKVVAYFLNLYDQEINAGHFTKEACDFNYCYMTLYRDCDNFDDYVLYIEDDKLYAYISFDVNSIIKDEDLFNNLGNDYYKIEIK